MDKELRRQLEWMNENLMAIAQNQVALYCELQEIEGRMQEPEGKEE